MTALQTINSKLFKAMTDRETSLIEGGAEPVIARTYDMNPDGTLSGPTPDVINVPSAPAPAPATAERIA